MTAALIPRVRLVRAMLEAMQPEVQQLIRDTAQAEQLARVAQSEHATTLFNVGAELTGAISSLAEAVGCLDDGLTGLETVAIAEANPGATDAEFDALLHARSK